MEKLAQKLHTNTPSFLEMRDIPPPYSVLETPITPVEYGPSFPHLISLGNVLGPVASPPGTDLENQGNAKKVLLYESSKLQRSIFLRHVYAILAAQGAIICSIIALLLFIPHLGSYFQEMPSYIFWPVWAIVTIITCAVTRLYKQMRKAPLDLVMLTLVTIFIGFTLGTLAAWATSLKAVLICTGIVTGVCIFVVLFTFQHRFPYTPAISMLYVLTLLLIIFGILCLSYGQDISNSVVLMIAPTLVCTYFATTTQLMVRDKEKAITSTEYVFGAVLVLITLKL